MIDFPRVLGRLLHRPSIVPAPAFTLRLAFGEVADALLLASQRAMAQRVIETGYAYRYTQLEEALAAMVERP
jgi:NAD dependent epimerase/dehydratase family enzyme